MLLIALQSPTLCHISSAASVCSHCLASRPQQLIQVQQPSYLYAQWNQHGVQHRGPTIHFLFKTKEKCSCIRLEDIQQVQKIKSWVLSDNIEQIATLPMWYIVIESSSILSKISNLYGSSRAMILLLASSLESSSLINGRFRLMIRSYRWCKK